MTQSFACAACGRRIDPAGEPFVEQPPDRVYHAQEACAPVDLLRLAAQVREDARRPARFHEPRPWTSGPAAGR